MTWVLWYVSYGWDTVWADDEMVLGKYCASKQTMLPQSPLYKADIWTPLFLQYKISENVYQTKFHIHWSIEGICGIMLILNEMVTNDRSLSKFYHTKTCVYESVFSLQGEYRGNQGVSGEGNGTTPQHKRNLDIYIDFGGCGQKYRSLLSENSGGVKPL